MFEVLNLLIQFFNGRVRGTQGPTVPPDRIFAVVRGGPFLVGVVVRGPSYGDGGCGCTWCCNPSRDGIRPAERLRVLFGGMGMTLIHGPNFFGIIPVG